MTQTKASTSAVSETLVAHFYIARSQLTRTPNQGRATFCCRQTGVKGYPQKFAYYTNTTEFQ